MTDDIPETGEDWFKTARLVEPDRQQRIDDSIAAQLARSLKNNARLHREMEELRKWTGAERYWEARWRDEDRENVRLREVISERVTELLTFNNILEERARKAEREVKRLNDVIFKLLNALQ